MAAYLNGQAQAAYLNGQPQSAYLNGQLVIGGAVLLDLFTENYNNGIVDWLGFNNGFLVDPAPNFGSLNPGDVNGKTITALLNSEIIATGNLTNWFGGPLGERLLRELGSKVHIYGPGYDQVWSLNDLNTVAGTDQTSYRYIPANPDVRFPNNTLLTAQLGFEKFDVINVMTAAASGDLLGYDLDAGLGSMSPDFINGAQIAAWVTDSTALTLTLRVNAVVTQDWWGKLHVNGATQGVTHLNGPSWVFTTGAGFSQWVRTYTTLPTFVDTEEYDLVFEQTALLTHVMVAGAVDVRLGYVRAGAGSLLPDTLSGVDVAQISNNDVFDRLYISLVGINHPQDFWTSIQIDGPGVSFSLLSADMDYLADSGGNTLWNTPDNGVTFQSGETYDITWI